MKKLTNKNLAKTRLFLRRKNRTNTVAKLEQENPRLIVNRSNKYNYAQVVGVDGSVIVSFTDLKITEGTKKERARKVGLEVGKLALEKGLSTVVFDRNGHLFHGRVKELADGAREAGLKF